MKNKGLIITLIVFLVLLIVSLIILMVKMMNGNLFLMFNHQVSKQKIIEETYDIMDIDINSKVADIHIIENTENNIKVIVYSEQKRTQVEVNNNKLVITSNSKKCIGFCINTKIDKVELYIPNNYKNSIMINDDVGDIKVGKFNDLVLNITTDAGDIDIASIKKANIKSDAGDIDIENIDSIIIDTDAGDIDIESVNKYLNIKADAGDIKINNVNLTKNSKIKTDAGDIKINKTNDIYINAKTDVGDTKINNNNRKSDIELNIKTDVGDIKVN